jgi:hypothetical protein
MNAMSISLDRPLLFMLLAATVLLFLLLSAVANKRRCASAARCRSRGWWAVALAPLLMGLYFIGSHRVERANDTSGRAAAEMAAVQHDLARHHAELAHRTAEMSARIQHQIAGMDIHALMDKADGPRIALPPDPPSAPETPAEAPAAEAASESTEESTAKDEGVLEGEAESTSENDASAEEPEFSDAASETESAKHETADGDDAATREAAEESGTSDERADKPAGLPAMKVIAALRPAWVDDPPKRVGNTWRNVIVTDEFATKEDCDREADRSLRRATFEHLQALVGKLDDGSKPRFVPIDITDETVISDEDRSAAGHLNAMGITIDYIRREIAKDEYLETVERSFGPMKKLYTLVEFTPAVDRDLRARWDDLRRRERFAVVGIGAASMLGLLGMAWGLLRVDTLTRGYYTKRLFVGVPAAIIMLVALLAMMVS